MPEHEEIRWVTGPVASSLVTDDPFWSAVRRRDADIDIAVLPPERPEAELAERGDFPALDDPESSATRLLDRTRAAWSSYVDVAPATEQGRWTSGPVRGTVRREVTLAADGVEEVVGARALRLAADALRADGWHVLVPGAGMPRVLAGRGDGDHRGDVQLVWVPDRQRLVLRVRSEPLAVTDELARELVIGR